MLYPWQNADYSALVDAYKNHRFTTLLLHGAGNSGKEALFEKLCSFILCLAPKDSEPCNECSACILFKEGNHPDFYTLESDTGEEKKETSIKIEQVREATNFAIKSQHISARKVILLPNVNQLNLNSANALLKILEEPPQNCIFILVADNINQVLPTILSRCFKYQLNIPSKTEALEFTTCESIKNKEFWLEYFNGEPLFDIPFSDEQLELLEGGLLKPSIDNIFLLSRELDPKKIGMDIWLDFLLKWLSDLASIKLGSHPSYFAKINASMQELSKRVNPEKIFALYDELIFLNKWSQHPLNHKLQLENILFKYQQIYT